MALGWLRNDKAEFRLFAAVLILKVSVTFSCVDKLAAQFFVILLIVYCFVLLMILERRSHAILKTFSLLYIFFLKISTS